MIASLPMYWRAENVHLWQAFWEEVRSDLPHLPALTPPEDIPQPWTGHWLRDDLALSLTCSLPFRTTLRNRVAYIGTLDFAVSDRPGYYLSTLVTHPELTGTPRVLAINQRDSHSGWAVAQRHPVMGSIEAVIETGAHAASLRAVAEGKACAAFIDAITLRILQQTDPTLGGVRIAGHTAPSPGLPLIAAKGTDPAPLRVALTEATKRFAPDTPELMGGPLSFHVLDESAYHDLPIPAPPVA